MNHRDYYLDPETRIFYYRGTPAFGGRTFQQALKFDASGYAPVMEDYAWYYLDQQGEDAGLGRYKKAYNFYEGRAAVNNATGWFHILPSGVPLYTVRYAWCGNFQQGAAVVLTSKGDYLHVDDVGQPLYRRRGYRYAGDFRDGVACVMLSNGMYRHLRTDGTYLHDEVWLELGVYHKGYATARDAKGWCHIGRDGKPIYEHRFQSLEPFYNGRAKALSHDGTHKVVTENGTIHDL